MASLPDVADGCAKILVPLLCFLGRPSPRSPAVDEAVVFLLVLLPTASYLAGAIVNKFAGVVFAYLQLAGPASVYLRRFVVFFLTLVFAWLIVVAALFFLGALGAGKPGIGPGFSWNVLS